MVVLVDLNLPVDLSYCTAVLIVDLNLAVLASTKFTGSTRRSSYTVPSMVLDTVHTVFVDLRSKLLYRYCF